MNNNPVHGWLQAIAQYPSREARFSIPKVRLPEVPEPDLRFSDPQENHIWGRCDEWDAKVSGCHLNSQNKCSDRLSAGPATWSGGMWYERCFRSVYECGGIAVMSPSIVYFLAGAQQGMRE